MTKTDKNAVATLLILLIITMAMQVYLHFAPGAMSPDSFTILAQARSGIFEDGHPPLMAAIWRLLELIEPGATCMLLFDLILFYIGLATIYLWALEKYGVGVLPAALTVGLFPPIISILGVIWADLTMAGFFLAAVGINLTGCASKKRRFRLAGLVVATLLACFGIGLRHNGAAAAFPLVSLFLFHALPCETRPLIRLIVSLFAGLLLTLIIFFGVKQVSDRYVDVPRFLWRIGALYDIAGTSNNAKEYLFYSDVLKGNSLQDVYDLYSPRSFTPLVVGQQIHALPGSAVVRAKPFEFDVSNPLLNERLAQNWKDAIVHHPGPYFQHRFHVFMSLTTRSPWGLWASTFDSVYPNNLGIVPRPVRDSVYFSFIKRLAQNSVCFVPLLYLAIGSILLVPALVFGLRLRNDSLLIASALYASGLTHMLGLFFFAASADFRYSHWTITATVVATSLVLLELFRFIRINFLMDAPLLQKNVPANPHTKAGFRDEICL
jgi:hypothetical protein